MSKYIIYAEDEDIRVVAEATNKREIVKRFNGLHKTFKADKKNHVYDIREGYFQVSFFGFYGMRTTDYWIARA